jgi:hypothetical protein
VMRSLPLSSALVVKRALLALLVISALLVAREACLKLAVWIGGVR